MSKGGVGAGGSGRASALHIVTITLSQVNVSFNVHEYSIVHRASTCFPWESTPRTDWTL